MIGVNYGVPIVYASWYKSLLLFLHDKALKLLNPGCIALAKSIFPWWKQAQKRIRNQEYNKQCKDSILS